MEESGEVHAPAALTTGKQPPRPHYMRVDESMKFHNRSARDREEKISHALARKKLRVSNPQPNHYTD
jgi:hypothetical protein